MLELRSRVDTFDLCEQVAKQARWESQKSPKTAHWVLSADNFHGVWVRNEYGTGEITGDIEGGIKYFVKLLTWVYEEAGLAFFFH